MTAEHRQQYTDEEMKEFAMEITSLPRAEAEIFIRFLKMKLEVGKPEAPEYAKALFSELHAAIHNKTISTYSELTRCLDAIAAILSGEET